MIINIPPLHEPGGFDWPLWRPPSGRIWIKGYHIILAHPALAGVAYFILGSLKFSRAEGFVSSFVSLACRMFLAPSLLSHLFFHLLFHLQKHLSYDGVPPPPLDRSFGQRSVQSGRGGSNCEREVRKSIFFVIGQMY